MGTCRRRMKRLGGGGDCRRVRAKAASGLGKYCDRGYRSTEDTPGQGNPRTLPLPGRSDLLSRIDKALSDPRATSEPDETQRTRGGGRSASPSHRGRERNQEHPHREGETGPRDPLTDRSWWLQGGGLGTSCPSSPPPSHPSRWIPLLSLALDTPPPLPPALASRRERKCQYPNCRGHGKVSSGGGIGIRRLCSRPRHCILGPSGACYE